MTNVAVIGANYGDEGKGRMVAYFAEQFRNKGKHPLVVRYNGGAQAGHTVQLEDGRRHIFSHFGSGTLHGASTYWSQYCIVEPRTLLLEYERLVENFDIKPVLHIDSRCMVTTPFDILFNVKLEESRGKNKHGSVGLGINETIERNQWPDTALTYGEFFDLNVLQLGNRMLDIWEYYKRRAVQFGLSPDLFKEYDGELVKAFVENMHAVMMLLSVKMVLNRTDEFNLLKGHDLIFEGAQGLLLDEMIGDFPHVTRSRTGLHNITNICRQANIQLDEVCYVTRAYMTRHGDGPFNYKPTDLVAFKDETNVPNASQGTMRIGAHHGLIGAVFNRVCEDLNSVRYYGRVSLAVTCLDHLLEDDRLAFARSAKRYFPSKHYLAYGPSNDLLHSFEV